MTNKLDDIRERLMKYDAAAMYFKGDHTSDVNDTEFRKHDNAWDAIHENNYNDLRALLAVVDAAAALLAGREGAGVFIEYASDEAIELIENLESAVAELTGDSAK